MAAAMEHVVRAPDGCATELKVHEDWARFSAGTRLEPGQKLGADQVRQLRLVQPAVAARR